MIIGERIRLLRESKKLSQGDIEKRTGLLRCYISRVENGHTVPAIETLEKLARAMEVPLYQLFYDGEEPPELPNLPKRKSADDIAWGSTGKEARFAVYSGASRKPTGGYCCTWPKRWPTASLFTRVARIARFTVNRRQKLWCMLAPLALNSLPGTYSHSMVLGGFELIS
jgi:transcriptional regulator with XRE-family HTH domain